MFNRHLEPDEARALMVKKQLAARSITDPRVLTVMGQIPRHLFVDEDLQDAAYRDSPLAIGYGQTISQPYIVAFMTQELLLPEDGRAVVLEVGTGSGYQTAILSRLAARVYSIERIEALAKRAQRLLHELDIHNVAIKVGDGGYGWPEHSPYDAIIATAAAPDIPPPLIDQLKDGGRLVAPIGPKWQQELIRLQWKGDEIVRERLAPVAFVPLIGEHGWAEDEY
ncbi:MAG: protein-L-isoaspartate(D-aspartate) O-methyltransferase [Anaerolineae bacterium]|nr:protein-L-isoaspartate(D-aspartate) O-methyltransferase [Anaerolineae bacterium]